MENSGKELIDRIIYSLETLALRDIKIINSMKSTGDKECPIAVFILSLCFIDQMSAFVSDKEGNKDRYTAFVKEYLPEAYDSELLYGSLRCGLVHQYSSGTFILSSGDKFRHLEQSGAQIYFHTDTFVEDISEAFEKFKLKIRELEPSKIERAMKRFDTNSGIIQHNLHIRDESKPVSVQT